MRKMLLLIPLVMTLAGCGVTRTEFPRQTSVFLLDFRPYTSAGFFFSADPYPGAYEPVGLLNVEIIPARGPRGDERLTADDLLKIAYDEAGDKGANGVANFTMTVEDAHVTVDELRERPQGGRYADEVYPVSSRSTVTVPVKRYKMSGSLIRITP